MVQFNLLPDVKLEYIKTRRRKQTVGTISILIAAGLFTIFVLLFLYVRVAQKQHISALDKDIQSSIDQLNENPDILKILTIQNQLTSLSDLHQQKLYSSRLVTFATKMTPQKANISNMEADFAAQSIVIEGSADALSTVNKFVDTIKFTEYQIGDDGATKTKAFSDVVLEDFSVVDTDDGNNVEYRITLNFDSTLFTYVEGQDNLSQDTVKLVIPNIISTRSATEQPADLFVPQPETTDEEEQ